MKKNKRIDEILYIQTLELKNIFSQEKKENYIEPEGKIAVFDILHSFSELERGLDTVLLELNSAVNNNSEATKIEGLSKNSFVNKVYSFTHKAKLLQKKPNSNISVDDIKLLNKELTDCSKIRNRIAHINWSFGLTEKQKKTLNQESGEFFFSKRISLEDLSVSVEYLDCSLEKLQEMQVYIENVSHNITKKLLRR